MKRFLFVTGALLAAAIGCDREPCATCTENLPTHRVELELGGSALGTKVSGATDLSESNVGYCTLYLFDRSGSLVDCFLSDDGRFDFMVTDRTYDFVAVANKRDLPMSGITKSELLACRTTLSENGNGNFVMAGCLDGHIIRSDEKITVEVSRIVAKVTLSVTTCFPETSDYGPLRIEDIYLTNVPGENDLAVSDTLPDACAVWYNRLDLETPAPSGLSPDMLYGHIGKELAARDSMYAGLSFYPYPNSSEDDRETTEWSCRRTRLVVRAVLAGRTTYYPVTFARICPNTHYHVKMQISGFGVDHPENNPDDYGTLDLKVSVDPWEEGFTYEAEI